MSNRQKIIHAQDILKNPEKQYPQCLFITDTCVMAWSFNSMATVINILAEKGYEAKAMWISPKGNLCYVIMQKTA